MRLADSLSLDDFGKGIFLVKETASNFTNTVMKGDFGLMKVLDGSEEVDREIFKESVGVGMPYYYRTPDLVAYANNKAPISTKSDVFQLGLVITQLFTGRNPCKVAPKNLDPVELEQLNIISGKLGGSISNLINKMLCTNPNERVSAADLIDPW